MKTSHLTINMVDGTIHHYKIGPNNYEYNHNDSVLIVYSANDKGYMDLDNNETFWYPLHNIKSFACFTKDVDAA